MVTWTRVVVGGPQSLLVCHVLKLETTELGNGLDVESGSKDHSKV